MKEPGAPLMHPEPDQPDQRQARPALPRHGLAQPRPQLAGPLPPGALAADKPPGVLAADNERLTRARPAAAQDGPWRPPVGRRARTGGFEGVPADSGRDPGPRAQLAGPRRDTAEAAGAAAAGAGAAGAAAAGAGRETGAAEAGRDTALADAGRETAAPADRQLRDHLEAVRLHAQRAASWLETSGHYARLINRDGVVPVTARFSADDLAFLAEAREEMLGFAELGLRLLELHQPLDAGGVASDAAAPALRCRSCMWRWPCPTFRTIAEVLDGIRPR